MKGEQEDSGIGVATRMDGRTDPKTCLGARHKGVKETPSYIAYYKHTDYPPVKKWHERQARQNVGVRPSEIGI